MFLTPPAGSGAPNKGAGAAYAFILSIPTPVPSTSPGSTATAPPTPIACVGDCGSDGHVTVDELLAMVDIALGDAAVSSCPAGDANRDGPITVDEILAAVENALNGCELIAAERLGPRSVCTGSGWPSGASEHDRTVECQ